MTDDVDVLYSLSSDSNGDQRNVTYRPGREGFSREWGQEKKDQWKHYMLLDPLTEQGRSSIAE